MKKIISDTTRKILTLSMILILAMGLTFIGILNYNDYNEITPALPVMQAIDLPDPLTLEQDPYTYQSSFKEKVEDIYDSMYEVFPFITGILIMILIITLLSKLIVNAFLDKEKNTKTEETTPEKKLEDRNYLSEKIPATPSGEKKKDPAEYTSEIIPWNEAVSPVLRTNIFDDKSILKISWPNINDGILIYTWAPLPASLCETIKDNIVNAVKDFLKIKEELSCEEEYRQLRWKLGNALEPLSWITTFSNALRACNHPYYDIEIYLEGTFLTDKYGNHIIEGLIKYFLYQEKLYREVYLNKQNEEIEEEERLENYLDIDTPEGDYTKKAQDILTTQENE